VSTETEYDAPAPAPKAEATPASNGFLTAAQILEQPTLVIEVVDVPEWGGKVRLKHLSAKERDDFESSMVKMGKNGRQQMNNENFRARLVQLAAVRDDAGAPMFTRHDIKTLGSLPASGLQRVFNKINEMSAFSEDDLKDLTEDFDDDQTDDSSSD
jgi:hypothetical protein